MGKQRPGGMAVRLTGIVLGVVVAGAAWADPGFTVHVVDDPSGRSLEGVKVSVSIDGSGQTLTTDALGRCSLELPAEGLQYGLTATVTTGGYVPVIAAWQADDDVNPLPREYMFRLKPGTSIGGTVRDSDGVPMAGVSVQMMVKAPADGVEHVALTDHTVETNEAGEWRCDIVPENAEKVMLRIKDPQGGGTRSLTYGGSERSLAALRDFSDIVEFAKRYVITGRVVDTEGREVRRARVVAWLLHEDPQVEGRTAATGFDGTFAIDNCRPGDTMVCVHGKGYAPALEPVTVGKDMQPLDIVVEPGGVIKLRVQRPTGEPLVDAWVKATAWRGYNVLDWSGSTDAEGRVTLDSAPPDTVVFDVLTDNDVQGSVSVSPADEEQVVAPQQVLSFPLYVVDSDSEEPVPVFAVTIGTTPEPGLPFTWSETSLGGVDGACEIELTGSFVEYGLRIEADGYEPYFTPRYPADAARPMLAAALDRPRVHVLVADSNGGPVPDATVLSAPAGGTVDLDGEGAYSGEDGRCAVPDAKAGSRLVAYADQGFGEAILAAGEEPRVTLEPWGAVEGRVVQGDGQSVSGCYVCLARDADGLRFERRTVTDSDGAFSFDEVPPGEAWVYREFFDANEESVRSHGKPVDVKPGETASLTVGGNGRDVTGTLELPAEVFPRPQDVRGTLTLIQPPPPYPPHMTDPAARKIWEVEWLESSPEGALYRRSARSYAVIVAPDGAFKSADVPAGEYELTLRGDVAGQAVSGGIPIVAVAPSAAGDAAPVNAGRVTLK